MKGLKILQLPNSYLPWSLGGKEVYAHELSKHLNQIGAVSEAVIHKYNKAPEGKHNYEGSTVTVLPPVKVDNLFKSRFTRKVDEAPEFEDFLISNKPDIVHFHDQNDGASLTHLKIVRKHGIKSVLTFHTPGQMCPQRAFLYKNSEVCHGRHILDRCTYCQLKNLGTPDILSMLFSKRGIKNISTEGGKFRKLVNFRSLTARYFESFQEFCDEVDVVHIYAEWAKAMFIDNGILEDKIRFFRTGGRPSMKFEGKRFFPPVKIVFIGRCTAIKGIHVLIDAVKSLDHSYGIEVHFFGPSWENTEYGKEMKKRIAGDSRFKGPVIVPNHLLAEELKKMDVCVIPSIWLETGPITVFDAFSVGLPVIGSDLGGIKELVEHEKNGLLFRRGDSVDLRAKIVEIMDKNKLAYLSSNISANRTMADVAKDTLNLYEEICG